MCARSVNSSASRPAPVTADTATSGGWAVGRLGAHRSAFVYTVTMGARGGWVSWATCARGGAGYSDSGCKYAMTSASAMARSAAARIASCSLYSGSSKPGESVKMNCASSRVSSPMTGRRVDCGFGATMARCSPTRALRRVDFPTLGRPAKATVPQRVMRGSYGLAKRRAPGGYSSSHLRRCRRASLARCRVPRARAPHRVGPDRIVPPARDPPRLAHRLWSRHRRRGAPPRGVRADASGAHHRAPGGSGWQHPARLPRVGRAHDRAGGGAASRRAQGGDGAGAGRGGGAARAPARDALRAADGERGRARAAARHGRRRTARPAGDGVLAGDRVRRADDGRGGAGTARGDDVAVLQPAGRARGVGTRAGVAPHEGVGRVVRAGRAVKNTKPAPMHWGGLQGKAGGGLLSHGLATAVPSALTGLTTVFGMGTGVALSR